MSSQFGAAAPELAGTRVRTGEIPEGDFLKHPTGYPIKDVYEYLDNKRIDDGIPGHLWRVHDKLYDLGDFVEKHPGGAQWIALMKGTDITELFEIHHLDIDRASAVLKLYESDVEVLPPRRSPFTFERNGFYCTLRRRVWEKFGADSRKHRETAASIGASSAANLLGDAMVMLSMATALAAGRARSRLGTVALTIASGIVNGSFIGIGHNFMHQRQTWRRHYFDFSGRSVAEMRVHHALSHHAYTNSIVDVELQRLEPRVSFMPGARDEVYRTTAPVALALFMVFGTPLDYMQRLSKIAQGRFRGSLPEHLSQLLPLAHLGLLASGRPLSTALLQWFLASVATSTAFQIGNYTSGPHFNSSVWHQGDMLDSLDWGIAQVQSGIERSNLSTENTTRANCVNTIAFGLHYLHHLFPTVDAMKLSELVPLFQQTCEEFGVLNVTWSNAELRRGLLHLLDGYEPNDRTLNGLYTTRSKL